MLARFSRSACVEQRRVRAVACGDEAVPIGRYSKIGRSSLAVSLGDLLLGCPYCPGRVCVPGFGQAFVERSAPGRHMGLQAQWVHEGDRVVAGVGVPVRSIHFARRVRTDPVADERGVVAVLEDVEARRIVLVLPDVTDVPEPHLADGVAGDEGGSAVWEVLLVGEKVALAVEVECDASEPASQMEVLSNGCDVVGLSAEPIRFPSMNRRQPLVADRRVARPPRHQHRVAAGDAGELAVSKGDDLAGFERPIGEAAGRLPEPSRVLGVVVELLVRRSAVALDENAAAQLVARRPFQPPYGGKPLQLAPRVEPIAGVADADAVQVERRMRAVRGR